MGGDASFVEYVAARWSMLYRLAVLLSGPEVADDLTQTALVRACASWRRVREDPSPDLAVKQVLVRTAVRTARALDVRRAGDLHGSGDTAVDTEGADREVLWSRFGTLPPRQRAVVVLLYHEGLRESEIARMLGCTRGTVTAEAFAALVGHLDVATFTTRDLADELARRADAATVPLPPVDELVARGRTERRRRTRRSLTWTAAAAGLVAVVLATASVTGSGEVDRSGSRGPSVAPPGSLAKLPVGDPADVAYSSRQTLYVDGHAISLADRPSAVAETPSRVFAALPEGVIIEVERATLAVTTVTEAAAGPMVVDARGGIVAWPVVRGGRALVVVRSVGADGLGAQREQVFPARPRCCDNPFLLVGITGTGDVLGSVPAVGETWAWNTHGGPVREIHGLAPGLPERVTGDELVTLDPPYHYAVGEVRGDGFLVTARYRTRSVDIGDPRGQRLVYVDDAGETHVRARRPRRARVGGNDVRLLLPPLDAGFAGARWEDTGHVLLDVSDDLVPFGALVRCDVDTGACEIATAFTGPHVVAEP